MKESDFETSLTDEEKVLWYRLLRHLTGVLEDNLVEHLMRQPRPTWVEEALVRHEGK